MPSFARKPKPAPGAPGRVQRTKPLTPTMGETLEKLEFARMRCYRVGYAHTPAGPFTHRGTIEALWRAGLVDYSKIGGMGAHITREGIAALKEFRNARAFLAAEMEGAEF